MAKFISIETTDTARGKVLVGTDKIFAVMPGDGTAGGGNVATMATIFHTGLADHIVLTCSTGTGTQLANAINSAITANPGGVLSIVRTGASQATPIVVSDVLVA
jgi:hypothetical protein